jgi:hypothetical protein
LCLESIQHISSAKGVDLESFTGLPIRPPHQGLGGEVEDKIGSEAAQGFPQLPKITNIRLLMSDVAGQSQLPEKWALGRQGIPSHLCTEFQKPSCQPTPFESGMARDPNLLSRERLP